MRLDIYTTYHSNNHHHKRQSDFVRDTTIILSILLQSYRSLFLSIILYLYLSFFLSILLGLYLSYYTYLENDFGCPVVVSSHKSYLNILLRIHYLNACAFITVSQCSGKEQCRQRASRKTLKVWRAEDLQSVLFVFLMITL